MQKETLINWLLQGDVSIRYQVTRDLLGRNDLRLQQKIALEGWGARFLSLRNADGHWGMGYYQPKWTSSHYTLLDLRNLCLPPENAPVQQTVAITLRDLKSADGGIYPCGKNRRSDVCLTGMFLNVACYFRADAKALQSIIDFLLSQQMPDGGFNCHSNTIGAVHSSLHTTLSVLEGLLEYDRNGYVYKLPELTKARKEAEEFILVHRLYKSHRTGNVIRPAMLRLPYPYRWYYDILRALDYFRYAGVPYDDRMEDALDHLEKKRRKDHTWPLPAKIPGKTHFDMEKSGRPSRWNTLRAMRVRAYFNREG